MAAQEKQKFLPSAANIVHHFILASFGLSEKNS